MYSRFLQLFLNNQIENLAAVFNDEYNTHSHTKKGEGSKQPTEPQHTPTTASPSHVEPIPTVASSSHPNKTHKRRKAKSKVTEIPQSSEPTNLDVDKVVHEERGDSVERAATTAASLDAEQDSGGSPRCQEAMRDTIAQTRSERVSTPSYDSHLLGVNTPRSDEERIELKELMDMCTKLSDRVLDLENVKDAQALEIKKLKKRVKKLEKKKRSRTPQLKRRLFKVRIESSAEKSLGDQEDASKKERNEIDQDKGISWFQEDAETQGRYSHDTEINTASTSITTAITTASEIVTTAVDVSVGSPTRLVNDSTTYVTLAETLMAIRRSDLRLQKLKGVVFKEPSEPTTTSRPQPQIPAKDKGKGIMQEPEKPVKVKGKDQIEYDADVAQRLQAELDEEARLEREREEEASNAALIEEWDSIEARIDDDAQLAERLQEEEREQMSVKEQARLLMELIATRKKFFTAKRAEEQRNKPPTKAEQRKKISYKHVNDFVPMDTKSSRKKVDNSRKKAESSKKRTRAVLGEESVKRQNVEDDAEKAQLKACLEIVPSDDSDVNIESLATKYPIVDWKTHILAKDIIYYQIIRADGSTKYYKIFSAMLDDFDKQDVLDLYRLVKERFKTQARRFDRVLWGSNISTASTTVTTARRVSAVRLNFNGIEFEFEIWKQELRCSAHCRIEDEYFVKILRSMISTSGEVRARTLFILSSSNRRRLLGIIDLMRQKNKRMKQKGLIRHYGILQKIEDSTRYVKEGNKINIIDGVKICLRR
ncbi:hypothetical protein Tco_0553573 [Tanacetum coccineum]